MKLSPECVFFTQLINQSIFWTNHKIVFFEYQWISSFKITLEILLLCSGVIDLVFFSLNAQQNSSFFHCCVYIEFNAFILSCMEGHAGMQREATAEYTQLIFIHLSRRTHTNTLLYVTRTHSHTHTLTHSHTHRGTFPSFKHAFQQALCEQERNETTKCSTYILYIQNLLNRSLFFSASAADPQC